MKRLDTPLMDAIDKRNYQQAINSRVIKGYNVNYIPNVPECAPEESTLKAGDAEKEEDTVFENSGQVQSREELKALEKAEEIFARLQREAIQDEQAKYDEWSEKIQSKLEEEKKEKYYNPKTGSYSGYYGQEGASDELLEFADRVKNENNNVDELVRNYSRQMEENE